METKEKEEQQQENPVYNGGIAEGHINNWKQQHGRVVKVEVTDEETGETHVGYFRRPDMKIMQAVSATSKNDEVKGSEVLFDSCWLGGSESLKTDAVYKMEAMAGLSGIFGKCVHKLKNL